MNYSSKDKLTLEFDGEVRQRNLYCDKILLAATTYPDYSGRIALENSYKADLFGKRNVPWGIRTKAKVITLK